MKIKIDTYKFNDALKKAAILIQKRWVEVTRAFMKEWLKKQREKE